MPMGELEPRAGDALVIVDVQNDFVTGSLAVPDGRVVVGPLVHAAALFAGRGLPVAATRDWHPADHVSFREQGGPWPPHCVAGTAGADYVSGLDLPADTLHIRKATASGLDAYSGFEGTTLADDLRARGVTRVFVGGLATDYCVLNTVIDAVRLGFDVVVLADAIRAVNVGEGDGARAEAAMREAGARFADVSDLTHTAADAPPGP
ncbi:MAG: isochorismatase family protein [Vicinamibacterales bacterium]